MKITKAKLKQIIVEELESVMKEDEEEANKKDTDSEQVDEAFGQATAGPSHRDRPSYQKATVGGRVANRTPVLDAAADALGMSPSEVMLALAKEMGVEPGGQDDPALPVDGEPAFPEGL
jgi:hypothetical protein